MTSQHATKHALRQLQVLQIPENAPGQERLDRLTSLLAEALARRLGQVPPAADYSATPLDYPTVVSPNAIAKFAVSTEDDL